MIIRVYVDDKTDPVTELPDSSGRLMLDTTALPDGPHRLRIETRENGSVTGLREIPFTVRNGPGIAVAGLTDRDEVRGRVGLVVSATNAGIDGHLDVHGLEVHRGLPFWMGVAAVVVVSLCALYLAIDPWSFRAWHEQEVAMRGRTAAERPSVSSGPLPAPFPMTVSLTDGSYLPALPFDASKTDAVRGAAIYAAKCVGCHGDDGQGRNAQASTLGAHGVFPRLAAQPAAYLYRQLWSFAHGWRQSVAMPPMTDGLTQSDWADIAQHLSQLPIPNGPVETDAPRAALILGEAIATLGRPDRGVSPCLKCHGSGGEGVRPHFPALLGQDPRYTASQIVAFRTGQRRNSLLRLMDPVAHGLEPHEIEAVSLYFAAQRPGSSP